MKNNASQGSSMTKRAILTDSNYELLSEYQSLSARPGIIKSAALVRIGVVFVLFMLISLNISAQYL